MHHKRARFCYHLGAASFLKADGNLSLWLPWLHSLKPRLNFLFFSRVAGENQYYDVPRESSIKMYKIPLSYPTLFNPWVMPNICSCPSRCWWALPALLSLRRKGPSSPSTMQGIAPAPRNLAPRFWCPGPKAGPSPTPLTPLTPLTWPFSGHFKLGLSKCSIAALKKTQWHMPQELSSKQIRH